MHFLLTDSTISFRSLILGVLVSGGSNGGAEMSIEMYIPGSDTTCSLPRMPEGRYFHTQDGTLACGGGSSIGSTMSTCIKWSSESGSWTQSHTLSQKRFQHVSWATENGVYLIGGSGYYSRNTTELVKEDGSVEDGFSLKYNTK